MMSMDDSDDVLYEEVTHEDQPAAVTVTGSGSGRGRKRKSLTPSKERLNANASASSSSTAASAAASSAASSLPTSASPPAQPPRSRRSLQPAVSHQHDGDGHEEERKEYELAGERIESGDAASSSSSIRPSKRSRPSTSAVAPSTLDDSFDLESSADGDDYDDYTERKSNKRPSTQRNTNNSFRSKPPLHNNIIPDSNGSSSSRAGGRKVVRRSTGAAASTSENDSTALLHDPELMRELEEERRLLGVEDEEEVERDAAAATEAPNRPRESLRAELDAARLDALEASGLSAQAARARARAQAQSQTQAQSSRSVSRTVRMKGIIDESRVASAGILLELRMRNFLNHRKFEMQFNPNVNFIHGANGAGKSSILHAIQVVFGLRARETNRGSANAQLIHYGRDEAEVSIVLKNEGMEAFKPDVYGKAIRITRTIKRPSGGGYEVRNHESGELVSKSASEVEELCAHFSIQVGNPCVVMTQEVSKKFLQNKKAEDKYLFFLNATRVTGLKAEMRDVAAKSGNMRRLIDTATESIPDIEKQIKELEKLETIAEEASKLEEEKTKLVAMLQETVIRGKEIEFDRLFQQYKTEVERLRAKTAELRELKQTIDESPPFEKVSAEFESIMKQHQDNVHALEQQCLACDHRTMDIKRQQKEIKMRIKMNQERRSQFQRELKQVEAEIRQIEEFNSRDVKEAEQQRQALKQQLLKGRQTLEEKLIQVQQDLASLSEKDVQGRSGDSDLRQEVTTLTARRQQLSNSAQNIAHAIRQVEQAAGAGASAFSSHRTFNPNFGPYSRSIWDGIEANRLKFKQLPVGPLGEYVKLRREKVQESAGGDWLHAISECLSQRLMHSYVVDNFHDQQLLASIINEVWRQKQESGFKPGIVRLKASPRYVVLPPKTPFKLVSDCVEIENDWAFNAITFLCKPERLGLHMDVNTVQDALRPFRRSGDPNNNDWVSGVFMQDGSKVSIRGESAQGSVVRERPERDAGRKHFHFDKAELLAQHRSDHERLKARVQGLQRMIEEKQKEIQTRRAEAGHVRAEESRLKNEERTLARKLESIARKIQQLDDESDEARYKAEQKKDDTLLQDRRKQIMNELAEIDANISEAENIDHEQFEVKLREIQKERQEYESKIDDEQAAGEDVARRSGKVLRSYAKREARFQKLAEECQQHREHRDRLAEGTKAAEQHLNEATAAMEQAGFQRIETSESPEKLRAMIKAKDDALTAKRAHTGHIDLLDVQLKLAQYRTKLASDRAQQEDVDKNQLLLDESATLRIKKIKEFRRSMVNSASHDFNEILKKSGGSGSIKVDPVTMTLDLIVNPNVRDAERQDAADASALSGGERSVTTIAFIMAIGEQIDAPFRAMDEFDVFMDDQNRATSLGLIATIALQNKRRQYLFLTPHDVTSLQTKRSPYLTFHVLKPPQREEDTQARIDQD